MKDIKSGERRTFYDAALVDGADHNQAIMVAMGFNIDDMDFPPIGWYRALPHITDVFCDARDIDESDEAIEENPYEWLDTEESEDDEEMGQPRRRRNSRRR